jgi:hypothetical protein
MVLNLCIEHPTEDRMNTIESKSSANNEQPPSTATLATTRTWPTWGSTGA